ncbi:hypothetical protein FRB93_009658 [Tulasnella sp. JGI-2019a]|nr:hypothetical protein FRB93_009658 [Tulasnella sp. JGI-2019a]
MDLLDRSLLLSASSIPDSHSHMVRIHRDMVNVTEDATSHAIKKHRLGGAVEIAERWRALLFTHMGNYRTLIKDLEVVDNGLADRFRALSTALNRSATSLPGTTTIGDEVARWPLTEIALSPRSANLQKAAAGGPVILVNISHNGSHHLIITTTQEPLSVPLPEATPDAVKVLANALIKCTWEAEGDRRLMEMLRDIRELIVAPIAHQLETALGLQVGSHSVDADIIRLVAPTPCSRSIQASRAEPA